LIDWLLKEYERNPATLFRKKDLLKKSKKQFEELKRRGFLTYVQADPHHETYPCPLTCSNTCPMDVVEMEGELFAICPRDTEVDPISLIKDDLSRYAFSIDRLLEQIRITNKIVGTAHSVDKDCTYIGYKNCRGVRAGFVFVANSHQVGTLKLIGLRQLCQDDEVLGIISPATLIEDVSERKRLYDEKIVQASLATSLDQRTFKLPIDRLVADMEARKGKEEMPSNYIACVQIAGIIRKRSDAIARTLRTSKYPVIKKANKNYCNPEHAALIWPKWKKYWKNKQ